MRRSAGIRRARATASGSLEARILGLSPYSFIEADQYTIDGVSGKVASFPEKVPAGTGVRVTTPTHAYSQAASANQVVIPTADALMRNRFTADFNGTPFYDSTAPVSAWRFLHDGTGCELFMAFVLTSVSGTQFMFTTRDATGTATDTGLSLVRNSVPTWQAAVRNAGAAGATLNSGTPTLNQVTYLDYSYIEGASPENILRLGGTTLASGSVTTPSTGDSSVVPRIRGTQRLASMLIFNRVLSDGERSIVQNYFLAKFGISA